MNERRRVQNRSIHFPFAFPFPFPAQWISRPREQGVPAADVLVVAPVVIKVYFSSSFSGTLDWTKRCSKSWLELLVSSPPSKWAIYISTLVSSPTTRTPAELLVNIGHSCWKHQQCVIPMPIYREKEAFKPQRYAIVSNYCWSTSSLMNPAANSYSAAKTVAACLGTLLIIECTLTCLVAPDVI